MSTPSAKFNIFQRLVRQWDGIHPYNAGQFMRLRGTPDLARWSSAWQESLDVLGLGNVRVTGSRYRHESLNGTAGAHGLSVLGSAVDLDAYLTNEMNRRFDTNHDCPFRPFLQPEPARGTFVVGLTYQHWVADSASIRTLLHDWFRRVFEPSRARTKRLRLPPGGYLRIFSPSRADWRFGQGLVSSVRWSNRFKRVRRIEDDSFNDFYVRYSTHVAAPGTIEKVCAASSRFGVTVNDVFTAALADVCDRVVPMTKKLKRQNLAIGTIVDLRPFVREDLSDVFGLFLGFTSVICKPDDFHDFPTLLRALGEQTKQHRSTRAALASPLRMTAGLVATKLLRNDRAKVINFYRKRLPMAGGISNVNLNRTWVNEFHPDPILDYVRISPTGPMMPLVLTPSTLGSTLTLGVTRRASVLDDTLTSTVVSQFLDRLESL